MKAIDDLSYLSGHGNVTNVKSHTNIGNKEIGKPGIERAPVKGAAVTRKVGNGTAVVPQQNVENTKVRPGNTCTGSRSASIKTTTKSSASEPIVHSSQVSAASPSLGSSRTSIATPVASSKIIATAAASTSNSTSNSNSNSNDSNAWFYDDDSNLLASTPAKTTSYDDTGTQCGASKVSSNKVYGSKKYSSSAPPLQFHRASALLTSPLSLSLSLSVAPKQQQQQHSSSNISSIYRDNGSVSVSVSRADPLSRPSPLAALLKSSEASSSHNLNHNRNHNLNRDVSSSSGGRQVNTITDASSTCSEGTMGTTGSGTGISSSTRINRPASSTSSWFSAFLNAEKRVLGANYKGSSALESTSALVTTRLPGGIRNMGNTCYIAATLQVFNLLSSIYCLLFCLGRRVLNRLFCVPTGASADAY